MAFFALLAIAVGVLAAMALVLVGLLEAPWPLLLAGLLMVFYGFQRLGENASPGEFAPLPAELVKLSEPDRGPAQKDLSTPAAAEDELIYRGIRYRVAKSAKSS
ncbi:MAG: hypothetical protein ACFCVD_09325 [Nodosilinea sp.]